MKNCGAVNPGTLISSATVVLNIFLNAVLIFGLFGFPALGIPGAALATVLSPAVQALCCIGFVAAKRMPLKLRPKKRDSGLGRRFFKRVLPALLNELIWGGGLTGVLLLALSPAITGLVSLTPTAKGYLKGMLLMSSYYFVGKSVNSMTVGGIFPAGGDTGFGLLCDTVTLWCVTIPLGCLCAFLWKLPVPVVYFVLNLDEIVKLPAVYRHYRKYGWLKNIT